MLLYIIASYVVLAIVGFKGLMKDKNKVEIAVFVVLMGIAFLYSLGLIYNWNLPEINSYFIRLFDPIANMIFNGEH